MADIVEEAAALIDELRRLLILAEYEAGVALLDDPDIVDQ